MMSQKGEGEQLTPSPLHVPSIFSATDPGVTRLMFLASSQGSGGHRTPALDNPFPEKPSSHFPGCLLKLLSLGLESHVAFPDQKKEIVAWRGAMPGDNLSRTKLGAPKWNTGGLRVGSTAAY